MIAAPATFGASGWLKENVAGALAYVTFVPAIVFLRTKPFNRNYFVRFHSFQSIFMAIAAGVVGLALWLMFALLSFIPRFGLLAAWLLMVLVALAWLFLWLVALVKALQGELFKLPIIGDFAERA